MKRTWFAILFLLLVAGLCIFEQHTVKTTFENMETLLQPLARDESDDLRPTIRQCQTELAEIYDNSKVTVGNIF